MAAELKPVLRMLVDEIQAVDVRIAELDRRMKDAARTNEACRRLVEVPGIGPLIATAVVAAVPDDQRFSSGRHFAAWVGLTPKQHSSGGKERLLGISKRGDAYSAANSSMAPDRWYALPVAEQVTYGTGSTR